MTFDVDDAGTGIMVAMTGLFWFVSFGSGSSAGAAETVIVIAFTAITLTQTGTISIGLRSDVDESELEATPATDGGERRADE